MSQANKATAKTERKTPEPIPVAILKSHATQPFDLPGADLSSSLRTQTQANRQGHTIHFMPWMRSFRVCYIDGRGNRSTHYIPEAQVARWDPVEE